MSNAIGAHTDEAVGRIRDSSVEVVDTIRLHGGGVAARLAEAADEARSAVSAHADEVVGRITTTCSQAVDAIKGQGDDVAAQLAQASAAMTNAVSAHADDVVGRIRNQFPSRGSGQGTGRRCCSTTRPGFGGDDQRGQRPCRRSRRPHCRDQFTSPEAVKGRETILRRDSPRLQQR